MKVYQNSISIKNCLMKSVVKLHLIKSHLRWSKWILSEKGNQTFIAIFVFFASPKARTMDTQRDFFWKSQTFGLGQTNWAKKFGGIWGIFSRIISTHFGTVSPLSMFSTNQPLFLQKTKPLYPNPKYLFGIGIWIWAAKN